MIKHVYLFLNRNIMAFNDDDNQNTYIQRMIGWNKMPDKTEQQALKIIIEDKPKIYLVFSDYRDYIRINAKELCSILGHGKWYLENYKNFE